MLYQAPGALVSLLVCISTGQLIVNVKNKGGEILKESIQSNTSQDTVTLEFQKSDGTLVTQFIDFKNEIQIFQTMVLGEEELGQTQFQVMCFVTRFVKNEFISSDAMSKLRQKNPSAVRHPEDDKGVEMYTKDLLVDINRSHVISPHIKTLCEDAKDSTYAREIDLKVLSRTVGKYYNTLLEATKMTNIDNVSTCRSMTSMGRPCMCRFEICIGWYPCGLKYCHGKDSSGKVVSYRCGIKTCHKCRLFDYYVKTKKLCLWDGE